MTVRILRDKNNHCRMLKVKAAFLTPYDLCKRWGKAVTPKTLANWRSLGIGPPFTKLQGRVVYSVDEVEAFEVAKKRPGFVERADFQQRTAALR
jgi:hypothetical protein